MKKQPAIFSLAILFFAGIAFVSLPKQLAISSKNFALIEYFTSDACYRCPPADEILRQAAKDFADKDVFVLAYHVDYKNDSLWSDAFSQAAFSERQRKYSRRFRLFSAYTPQAIVNGKQEMVGSDKGKLYASLRTALKDTATSTVEIVGTKVRKDSLEVTFKASAYKENILNIALVQKSFEQKVERGANRGKVLQHTNIVRRLNTIPFIGRKEGVAAIAIPAGLSVNDMKVIAFIQNRNTMLVTSAVSVAMED